MRWVSETFHLFFASFHNNRSVVTAPHAHWTLCIICCSHLLNGISENCVKCNRYEFETESHQERATKYLHSKIEMKKTRCANRWRQLHFAEPRIPISRLTFAERTSVTLHLPKTTDVCAVWAVTHCDSIRVDKKRILWFFALQKKVVADEANRVALVWYHERTAFSNGRRQTKLSESQMAAIVRNEMPKIVKTNRQLKRRN